MLENAIAKRVKDADWNAFSPYSSRYLFLQHPPSNGGISQVGTGTTLSAATIDLMATGKSNPLGGGNQDIQVNTASATAGTALNLSYSTGGDVAIANIGALNVNTSNGYDVTL